MLHSNVVVVNRLNIERIINQLDEGGIPHNSVVICGQRKSAQTLEVEKIMQCNIKTWFVH